MTFRAFIRLNMKSWPLFVISIIFFSFLIYIYGKRSVLGNTEYRIGVMTRFVEFGENAHYSTMSEKPIWKKVPAYNNAQLYGWLVSADLIFQAGMQEGFDVEYTQKGDWSSTWDVYNKLPYRLFFLDAKKMDEFSGEMTLSNNKLSLSNFTGIFGGKNILQQNTISTSLEKLPVVIETAMGRVKIASNPLTENYEPIPINLNLPIKVKRSRECDVLAKYNWDLKLEVEKGVVFLLTIKTSGSERRVLQLFNKMLSNCNELVKTRILEDIKEEKEIITENLNKLKTQKYVSLFSKEILDKEIKSLEKQLLQNVENEEICKIKDFIEVTDPPTIQPAIKAKAFIKVILLLLALVIPIFFTYLFWIIKMQILEINQMPVFFRNTLYGVLKGKRKDGMVLLENLCFDLIDKIKNKSIYNNVLLPDKTIIISYPNKSKITLDSLNKLVEQIGKHGLKTRVIELIEEGKKQTYSPAQTIELKKGFFGTNDFFKSLKLLTDKDELTILLTPFNRIASLHTNSLATILLVTENKTEQGLLATLNRELEKSKNTNLALFYTLYIR